MTVWGALVLLLSAALYAPLFHIHSDSGGAPLVHAHLPEPEISEDESVVHMESAHSHVAARSIDVLVTTASHFVHLDAVLSSRYAPLDVAQPSGGFVPVAVPRAHAPPEIRIRIPRAPPA
jgi:hypothetical protein